jgi:polysaccharide export outer membrane protein
MKKCLVLVAVFLLLGEGARADTQLHPRPRYVLHVGDTLDLNYRLTPEFNQTVTIGPDGRANLDIAGGVKLGGLTVEQAHDLIVQKVSTRLKEPELNLVLKDFQKPYVVVAGEVQQPGRIEMRENMTAMQAVMLAGGFRSSAHDTQILVYRGLNTGNPQVKEIDLHRIKKAAQLEHDIALEPGDMLLVPRNRLAHVSDSMKAIGLGMYFDPTSIPH